MSIVRTAAVAIALAALAGCGGSVRQVPMKDAAGQQKAVEFPPGTVLGGASRDQAAVLAQMVADANNAAVERSAAGAAVADRTEAGVGRLQAGLGELQAAGKREEEALRRIEAEQQRLAEEAARTAAAVEKVGATAVKTEAAVSRVAEGQGRLEEVSRESLDVAKKTWDTTRMIIEAFEKVSRRQGTGEVTVFFERGSARIARGSFQERRVVEFADWLGRESRGRKIMFVSVGSASATGPAGLNERLAKQRSEALLAVVDQYLVNVPHEYVKIYGTGDAYSPKGVSGQEHERYQHARLIAFFEKGQEPALPAETGKP